MLWIPFKNKENSNYPGMPKSIVTNPQTKNITIITLQKAHSSRRRLVTTIMSLFPSTKMIHSSYLIGHLPREKQLKNVIILLSSLHKNEGQFEVI